MQGRQEEIAIDGRKLALMRFGPAEAPPVLCLHGWLDNAHSFLPLAAALPDQHLIAVDLPGHGQSAHRDQASAYHQLDWVIDAVEIADHLGLSRFALLGHSMGAGIAALAAGTIPERVRALVMLEGVGPTATTPQETPERLRAHLQARRVARAAPDQSRGGAMQSAVRARMAFSDPLLPASAELLCERGVSAAPRGVAFSHDRRLQRPQPRQLSEAQILAFLELIRCPSLLVLAEDGLELDPAMVAGRRAAIQDLAVVTLPGGHHVHMDDAASVAHHVGPFLRGVA